MVFKKENWCKCPDCKDINCHICIHCYGSKSEICNECKNESRFQSVNFCKVCGYPLTEFAWDRLKYRLEVGKNEI